jgi:hypothetical protein
MAVRTTFVVCAVALLGLVGCSDGSDKASSTTTAAPLATGPTTTLRAVDTSFTGQGSANFCNLAKTYNEQSKNVASAATPTQLRTVVRDGRTAITQAVAAAPAEIKGDMEVLAAAFIDLSDAFDKANYDASKVNPASLSKLQAPEFQVSTQRFQAYLRNICKVTA